VWTTEISSSIKRFGVETSLRGLLDPRASAWVLRVKFQHSGSQGKPTSAPRSIPRRPRLSRTAALGNRTSCRAVVSLVARQRCCAGRHRCRSRISGHKHRRYPGPCNRCSARSKRFQEALIANEIRIRGSFTAGNTDRRWRASVSRAQCRRGRLDATANGSGHLGKAFPPNVRMQRLPATRGYRRDGPIVGLGTQFLFSRFRAFVAASRDCARCR
jgi:hypothetical protein